MELKAHSDISTGEIHGCEPNTKKWFHEKGHLVFNSSPNTSFLILVQQYAFDLWMVTIMLSFVNRFFIKPTAILWAIYIGIMLYEENWCNRYATKQMEIQNGLVK